jgi:hypothetical protein
MLNLRFIKIIQESEQMENKVAIQLFEFGGNGKLINPLPHIYNEIKYRSEIFNKPAKIPYLVVLFDDKGCPNCIQQNIDELNKLYSIYSSSIIVYYQGKRKNYISLFNPIFSYQTIEQDKELFTKRMDYVKPLVFLIGEDDIIYDIHRAEAGVSQKTILFYNKIKAIFDFSYFSSNQRNNENKK